jgi:hypothetical protein
MSHTCFYEGCTNQVAHSMSWTTLIDGRIEEELLCWMCEPCFQEWIEIYREHRRGGMIAKEQ